MHDTQSRPDVSLPDESDTRHSDRGEPDVECPECGASYIGKRAAAGCCRSGSKLTWDYEPCPGEDCGGHLQQQDQRNVICLDCGGVWFHWRDDLHHVLVDEDTEIVARKARSRQPRDIESADDRELIPDGGQEAPLDRLFVEDEDERPGEIVVDELTTMDPEEFVDRLESLAKASDTVTTMARDLERLRKTGLSDDDARDLIYGRNSGLTKRDIESMFDAVDQLASDRADRPVERLLSEISGLNLSETSELMDELDRLNRRYGGLNDE
jgi:hypothetical protein